MVRLEDLRASGFSREDWDYVRWLWIRDSLMGPDATNLGRSLSLLERHAVESLSAIDSQRHDGRGRFAEVVYAAN